MANQQRARICCDRRPWAPGRVRLPGSDHRDLESTPEASQGCSHLQAQGSGGRGWLAPRPLPGPGSPGMGAVVLLIVQGPKKHTRPEHTKCLKKEFMRLVTTKTALILTRRAESLKREKTVRLRAESYGFHPVWAEPLPGTSAHVGRAAARPAHARFSPAPCNPTRLLFFLNMVHGK